MLKHAYLIMAHEDTLVLRRLIQLLDNENNCIYIHIDRNSRFRDTSQIQQLVKKAKLTIYQKYKVYWGTNSITLAEIFLLPPILNRCAMALKGKVASAHM